MRRLVGGVLASIALLAVLTIRAPGAFACSPPFEPITLESLGPDQVVVVGRIGDRVPGGRVFHVERWFNGRSPASEILIAFKEGPAIGDCSYPVQTGQHLIIAPDRQADGLLHADLVTPQGDPADDVGRRYLEEANALFGPGIVPVALAPIDTDTGPPWAVVLLLVALGAMLVLGVVVLLARRGTRHGNG